MGGRGGRQWQAAAVGDGRRSPAAGVLGVVRGDRRCSGSRRGVAGKVKRNAAPAESRGEGGDGQEGLPRCGP